MFVLELRPASAYQLLLLRGLYRVDLGSISLLPGIVMHMSGAGSASSESRKIRVLVVDDNADAANSLGRLLSLLGKEVRVAHDGESGIAELESFAADVVLLDLGMHGMDGFETAQAIRARPDWNNVALVALTGWGQ